MMMSHLEEVVGNGIISSEDNNSNSNISRSLYGKGTVPINKPEVRLWELDENSTHYDRMVAAPLDEELIKMWSGWAVIILITGVVTTMILIPLLSHSRPKVRKNPFNIYLIFLLIPDMLLAWLCGFTCLSNALAGHFTTPFMCRFQSFYMVASIAANSWLNMLITRQMYIMLDAARQFKRYTLPTAAQVVKEAICVYIYALFLACLGAFPTVAWWPHKTRLTVGAACLPMDYDHASTAFFYGVFFPLLFVIPLAYVCWAAYQIYKHKMLPPTGRRRILTLCFFRLAAAFVIMWIPGLLLLFVFSAWIHPWVQWVGGTWSHMQGLVSAAISLLKPDIGKAVIDFWCCVPDIEMDTVDEFSFQRSIVTRVSWANSLVHLPFQKKANAANDEAEGDISISERSMEFGLDDLEEMQEMQEMDNQHIGLPNENTEIQQYVLNLSTIEEGLQESTAEVWQNPTKEGLQDASAAALFYREGITKTVSSLPISTHTSDPCRPGKSGRGDKEDINSHL